MAEANGVSRISLWFSIAASAIFLIGSIGAVFYIGFRVQSNADQLDAMVRRLVVVEDKITTEQDRLTKIEVGQNEIETQFCASDIVRNLMHANDLRISSMLWRKAFNTEFPTDNTYYPTICNRRVK